jgi:hypothetical protein
MVGKYGWGTIMNRIRALVIAVLLSSSVAHSAVPYVDPQQGENIWGLTSREGTALDYIIDQDIAITATVDNTFLLLQEIGMEVDAITATLATVITDISIITTTLNNTYAAVQEIAADTDLLLVDLGIITVTLNNTYQEVVNCCPCTYFIHQTDMPITLTAAGTYCLTEDINTNAFRPIVISGNDITLDLHGHTYNATLFSGIYVIGSTARIRIKNGTVIAPNGNGVYIFDGSINTDIVIEKIVAQGCQSGFVAYGGYQEIQYLQCTAKNCTLAGFHYEPEGNPEGHPTVTVYDQCSALNNTGSGFEIVANASSLLACTLTNCRSEANGAMGYNLTVFGSSPDLLGLSMFNCVALRNGQAGFYIADMHGIIFNCIAENNGAAGLALTDPSVGAGFYLPATTSGDMTLMGCIAINNSYSGFTDRNTTATNPNRFFNTYAIRNRAGTLNYDLASGVSQSVVATTTNLAANNNLSWWINMDGGV